MKGVKFDERNSNSYVIFLMKSEKLETLMKDDILGKILMTTFSFKKYYVVEDA